MDLKCRGVPTVTDVSKVLCDIIQLGFLGESSTAHLIRSQGCNLDHGLDSEPLHSQSIVCLMKQKRGTECLKKWLCL